MSLLQYLKLNALIVKNFLFIFTLTVSCSKLEMIVGSILAAWSFQTFIGVFIWQDIHSQHQLIQNMLLSWKKQHQKHIQNDGQVCHRNLDLIEWTLNSSHIRSFQYLIVLTTLFDDLRFLFRICWNHWRSNRKRIRNIASWLASNLLRSIATRDYFIGCNCSCTFISKNTFF